MDRRDKLALTPLSRTHRHTMTKEERHLWYDFFKLIPFTIRRQKVIGPFIVDFYCAEARLVIELDGSQHYTASGQYEDQAREQYLAQHGIKVLRYSNYELNRNFEGVCMDIEENIKARLE